MFSLPHFSLQPNRKLSVSALISILGYFCSHLLTENMNTMNYYIFILAMFILVVI